MKKKFCLILLFFFLFALINPLKGFCKASDVYDKEEIKKEIENIYNERNKVFITGDLPILLNYFDTSQKHGKWSLEHEVQRVKYLFDWAIDRGIKFTDIKSQVVIKRTSKGNGTLKVGLKEIYKFDYIYKEDETPVVNSFGVGILHTLVLTRKDDRWVVKNDWYTDCFEDALKSYSGEIKPIDFNKQPKYELGNCPKKFDGNQSGKYNRLKAVKYADKYCGANFDDSNNYKYNKKYLDFNGIGGDCSNFASQVLGDKEAGGLKHDGAWHCTYPKYGGGQGSRAWVNADGLRTYLIYSGRGTLIKKGKFNDLVKPTNDYPCGTIGRLELGDLICYAKGTDVDHFGVVTGWDSHGYPLINSHTTDRYHVPWDLGWKDKDINFHLIHIR